MTTTATTSTTTPSPRSLSAAPTIHQTNIAQQSWIMVRRNLIHTRRMPEMLSDVTIQPIMFVVLFAYVFGPAISLGVPGVSYKEYLLPGIMGQTIVFTAFIVATGITADIEKGIVDRFRSLPIRRSSVLVGRSIASLIHSSIGIVVMAVTGLIIGWRITTSVGEGILGFALVLLFGFGMIWFGVLIGSWLRSVEAVNGFMFTLLFPLTFVSNAFVPTANMQPWLRAIAEWNPMSALVQAMRVLWGNGPAAAADAAWPMRHPELATLIWAIVLTAVFAPFAVRGYNRRTAD
ncbi:ABC transporter permease [Gordonia sp. NPDC003376]